MRKLGKTFTEQYKFKRLLKTEPSVLRAYKQQELSINSIPAVKDIALYDDDLVVCPSPRGSEEISPDMASVSLLSRGEARWPRRIEFAEQITDINKTGRHVWAVNLHVRLAAQTETGNRDYIVNVRRIETPYIVEATYNSAIFPQYSPVNAKNLSAIDKDNKTFYYLCSRKELFTEPTLERNDTPWDVWSCGIVPNGMSPFNATFYDREVAKLYAESLREECRRIDVMYKT